MNGARLSVRGVELELRLGWGEEERSRPQRVELDLEIDFAHAPDACRSDDLPGTVCYDRLVREIRSSITECRLIEALAARVHAVAAGLLPAGSSLSVTVHKLAIPVPGVREAVFAYAAPARPAARLHSEVRTEASA